MRTRGIRGTLIVIAAVLVSVFATTGAAEASSPAYVEAAGSGGAICSGWLNTRWNAGGF